MKDFAVRLLTAPPPRCLCNNLPMKRYHVSRFGKPLTSKRHWFRCENGHKYYWVEHSTHESELE